jgi:hypothetical protein
MRLLPEILRGVMLSFAALVALAGCALFFWRVSVRVGNLMRDQEKSLGGATFTGFILLALLFALIVQQGIASKGGTVVTNTPVCKGSVRIINLIERDSGRLVPVGVPITEGK